MVNEQKTVNGRATLAEVAKYLNLTKPTVSRALNDYPDISGETKEIVKAAALKLGYSASSQAIRLKKGRSDTIGFITSGAISGLQAAYRSDFTSALSKSLMKKGKDLLYQDLPDDEAELEVYGRLIRTGKVDGFVIMQTRVNDPRIEFLLERGFPFVSQGRSIQQNKHAWVDIDSEQAIYDVTSHLIKMGHTLIGLVSGAESMYSSMFRRIGFENALRDNNISLVPGFIRQGDFSPSSGKRAILELAHISPMPTALVCASDAMALGVISGAMELGLRVPEDISVTGYDGVGFGEFSSPSLTTMWHSAAVCGDSIANIINALIEGETITDKQILVKAELIRRGSVRVIGINS